jgi:Holliday junction DNA helicase RuvB
VSGGARERGFASEVVEADGSYEATARVVDPGRSEDDRVVEAALRPRRLAEFPGQPRVRDQLGLVLEAARRRGRPPDHVLLSGPPGLGKTTLAMIVAAELEKPLRSRAARRSSTPETWRRCSPRSMRGRCSSSTRSTG